MKQVSDMTEQSELSRLCQIIEGRLSELFPGDGLEEAMRYSLLAGGKRVRPVLVLQFCKAAGRSLEVALDAACGVEMLHTYSLIHDDLPCMDDDELRRGRPTCHRMYGECVATLAGDALQAAAFEYILRSPMVEAAARARMGLALAEAVGVHGMCGGQYYDMKAEGRQPSLEELTMIHAQKTAALLKAACQIGVLAAGITEKTEEMMQAAADYAEHLGIAFQIRDDLLDVISTTEELGKPAGSDSANDKHTYVTLLGKEACLKLVEEHTEQAKLALNSGFHDTEFLCWLADELAGRTS